MYNMNIIYYDIGAVTAVDTTSSITTMATSTAGFTSNMDFCK